MDTYPINPSDGHYPQQRQQQPQWPPHLLAPSHPQASFPSPPASDHGQQHYYFQTQAQAQAQQQQQQPDSRPSADPLHRATSSLSLNLSSLTVTSPTNLSPINPPSAAAAALSPVTPISPSANPFGHGHHLQQHGAHNVHPTHGHAAHGHNHGHAPNHHMQQSPFAYDPSQGTPGQQSPSGHYDEQQGGAPPGSSAGYDTCRTPGPSRSSSSGTPASSQLPRKRSFTANPITTGPANASSTPGPGGPSNNSGGAAGNNGTGNLSLNVSPTLVEEGMYDDESRDAAMELASSGPYDDMDVRAAYGPTGAAGAAGSGGAAGGSGGSGGSPVDGSGSTSSAEDSFGMMGGGSGGGGGVGGTMNILGKPLATNNFVTKLYQMINDPKSAQFIAWTELGTSFVVSNVGEFSRSILGSHFKHNNFSSFVRQLNMYGFHKINRTPRAQRTSTDAQTWEFSHSKFLRGRQDLLDEIKRKALEPDPSMKHRVELPGEVAAQLNAMRDDNVRMWEQLSAERRKVDKLVNVVGRLWDVVGKGFPGMVPPFPSDLLEASESPNIYITSPTATSRYPPPLSMNLHSLHSMGSPNSSPTAADFPSSHMHHGHPHQSHSLSRQHSFQHISSYRGDSTSSTPLQSSPGSISMELFDDGTGDPSPSGRSSTKRQRLDESGTGVGVNNSPDSMSLMSSVSSPGSNTGPGIAGLTVPKKSSRARSDSAPLGYAGALWQQGGLSGPSGPAVMGRPRSGSGLMPRGILNIGNMTRNNNASTPLLSITTAELNLHNR